MLTPSFAIFFQFYIYHLWIGTKLLVRGLGGCFGLDSLEDYKPILEGCNHVIR